MGLRSFGYVTTALAGTALVAGLYYFIPESIKPPAHDVTYGVSSPATPADDTESGGLEQKVDQQTRDEGKMGRGVLLLAIGVPGIAAGFIAIERANLRGH